MSLSCLDCGLPYECFPLDLVVPRGQWLLIHPADAGVLCALCILARLSRIPGVTAVHAVAEVAPSAGGK
jgi:hypothetical protein